MANRKKTVRKVSDEQPELEFIQLPEPGQTTAIEFVIEDREASKRRRRKDVEEHQVSKRQSSLRKTFRFIDTLAEVPQSNLEQKLINFVLRVVQQTKPNSNNEYSFDFNEAKTALGIETRSRDYIIDAAKTLQSIRMSFNTLEGKDNAVLHDRTAFMVLVPTIFYDNGKFSFKINEDIRPFMSDKLPYAIIHESETSKLKLWGSVRLYEFACGNLHAGMTEKLDWEKLRDRMFASGDIPPNASTWSKFNDRFLKPSILEINNQTQIEIKLHLFRSGLRVKFLKLEIKRPDTSSAFSNLSPAHSQLLAMLDEFQFSKTEIANIFAKYSVHEIQQAYAFTRYKVINTTRYSIKKPARYMIKSLESGFHEELPNAAQLLGIVWVNDLKRLPSNTTFNAPVAASEVRAPSPSDVLAWINNKRAQKSATLLEEMSVEQRHALQAEYNLTAIASAKLNIGKRSKAGAVSMFVNSYARKIFGEIREAELKIASNELVSDPAGIKFLEKLRGG